VHRYSQAGNIFAIFDDRDGKFSTSVTDVCAKENDGVILLQNSSSSTFRMRIFNSDGGEADMCGNGICCMMKFAIDNGLCGNSCTVQTAKHILSLQSDGTAITATMPPIGNEIFAVSIPLKHKELKGYHINTGVPHIVIFSDNLETLPIQTLGAEIRYHNLFSPEGANVTFVYATPNKNEISIRTYERGIEGETNACGTGATAAALATAKITEKRSPISVKTRSGEILTIAFSLYENSFTDISLTGIPIFLN